MKETVYVRVCVRDRLKKERDRQRELLSTDSVSKSLQWMRIFFLNTLGLQCDLRKTTTRTITMMTQDMSS